MIRMSEGNRCDYDLQNDSIFFYGGDNNYKSSIDLDGIIIDFNEANYLMSIEILDASERFKISKYNLQHIKSFSMAIKITEENIQVTMNIEISIRNGSVARSLEALTINSMNIPPSTQEIAANC